MATEAGQLYVNVGAKIGDLEKGMAAATRTVAGAAGKMEGLGKSQNFVTDSTRSMTLVQMEAIKMNEAFGKTATSAHLSTGKLGQEMVTLTRNMLGLSPVVAQTGSMLGKMAVGDAWMIGILAGIAALGFAYDKLTESARESAKAIQEANDRARGPLGKIADDLVKLRAGEEDARKNFEGIRSGSIRGVLAGGFGFDTEEQAKNKLDAAIAAVKQGEKEWNDAMKDAADGRQRTRDEEQRKIDERNRKLKRAADEAAKIEKAAAETMEKIWAQRLALRPQMLNTTNTSFRGGPDALGRLPKSTIPQVGQTVRIPGEGAISSFPKTPGIGDKLGAVAGQLGAAFEQLMTATLPMAALMTVVSAAMKPLQPAIDALKVPLQMFGEIIGKALVPVLAAFWPVVKQVVIAASYVAQIFFNVAGAILKAVGGLVYGIAVFVDKIIPFVDPLKSLENTGKAMMEAGQGFWDAAGDMAQLRDNLKDMTFDDQMQKAADAAENFSDAVNNVARGFKVDLRRFQSTTGIAAPASNARGGITVHGDIHVHGVVDPKDLTDKVEKETQRRAARGGTGLVLGYANG